MQLPVNALLGGALIGASATLLLATLGRVAGVSGVLARLLDPRTADRAWRVAFLAGLAVAGVAARFVRPDLFEAATASPAVVVAGGLLVGFGTRLGNGCTSGHGVCGISRLSKRSIVATLTFMATAGITVFVVRHLLARGAS